MIQRIIATSLVRSARPVACRPCRFLSIRNPRVFSTSPRLRAIDNLPAFTAAFQKTNVFKKLANHPEAINAIRAMMETLQAAGVDVTSGTQPSTFKMAKLMMNSTFRDQIKVVAEEMKKAGVDLTSKEVMDEIMALKNAGSPK